MVTGARDRWVRVQLPLRPNGRSGWVPRDAVELRPTTVRLRVSVGARSIEVMRSGKVTATYPAGVGTGGTPTPLGLFAVQDTSPVTGELGPYILVLTAHSPVLRTFAGGDGIVGIHGWPDSSVFGKAVSHGCIRVAPSTVRALARIAPAGTPVEVVR